MVDMMTIISGSLFLVRIHLFEYHHRHIPTCLVGIVIVEWDHADHQVVAQSLCASLHVVRRDLSSCILPPYRMKSTHELVLTVSSTGLINRATQDEPRPSRRSITFW
mmetsp:Transcript_4715/g.12010  ORF Transcript_4715/g.12010 Transcript_4715/m.12010 type:complete len:107 (+) Transcript_4715:781-1101(+)